MAASVCDTVLPHAALPAAGHRQYNQDWSSEDDDDDSDQEGQEGSGLDVGTMALSGQPSTSSGVNLQAAPKGKSQAKRQRKMGSECSQREGAHVGVVNALRVLRLESQEVAYGDI